MNRMATLVRNKNHLVDTGAEAWIGEGFLGFPIDAFDSIRKHRPVGHGAVHWAEALGR